MELTVNINSLSFYEDLCLRTQIAQIAPIHEPFIKYAG